ncbi:MAG: hypothetical protein D3924_13715 [Candidatus Electrothrix sp. AR4]|nr:hypothetical protein [Candidatus Electrothrix sp. AR4]
MKTRVKEIVDQAIREMKKELLYSPYASRPRKILFDHLPKCGGASLNVYLEAHYPRRKTFSTNGRNPTASVNDFKNLSQRRRHGFDLVNGHLAHELLGYVHPECLKVTVLREPVERIISHYHYAKRSPEHYLYSKIHSSYMSLEDYATSDLSGELRNWYTTHFSGLKVDEAERSPEEATAKAFDVVLKRYDIIGFLDDFSSFAEALRTQADLRYEYQNRRVNVTQDRPSTNDVAQSVIIKIQQVNHLDIALYKKIRDAIG